MQTKVALIFALCSIGSITSAIPLVGQESSPEGSPNLQSDIDAMIAQLSKHLDPPAQDRTDKVLDNLEPGDLNLLRAKIGDSPALTDLLASKNDSQISESKENHDEKSKTEKANTTTSDDELAKQIEELQKNLRGFLPPLESQASTQKIEKQEPKPITEPAKVSDPKPSSLPASEGSHIPTKKPEDIVEGKAEGQDGKSVPSDSKLLNEDSSRADKAAGDKLEKKEEKEPISLSTSQPSGEIKALKGEGDSTPEPKNLVQTSPENTKSSHEPGKQIVASSKTNDSDEISKSDSSSDPKSALANNHGRNIVNLNVGFDEMLNSLDASQLERLAKNLHLAASLKHHGIDVADGENLLNILKKAKAYDADPQNSRNAS